MNILYLSESQIKSFFAAASSSIRDLLLFKMQFRYGLRISEALGIRLEDFDSLEHPEELRITGLKRGQTHPYPIDPEVAKLLKRWLKERGRILHGHVESGFLFVTTASAYQGKPMSRINAEKLLQKYGERSGLPRQLQHTHVFRHSCCVHLLSRGADVFFCKSWMRHKSMASTMVYANFVPPAWERLSHAALGALNF